MFEKSLNIFLLFFLISFTIQEKGDYWKMENNSISILPYKSSLNDSDRDNYYYWIGLRNSFYYSENSNQLEKLVKYFTPEEENYYKNIFTFSVPGLILAGVDLIVLVIYLVKRFLLKGCLGPKNVVKSYHYQTYFLIAFGCLVGIIFHAFALYNASKSNSNIKQMIQNVKEQKDLMNKIYNQDVLANKEKAESIAKKRPNTIKIDLSIYGEDVINKDFTELQNKLDNFEKDLNSIQIPKFNYQITSLVLFIIFAAVGISGYWLRREYIPLISSIILLLLGAPIIAVGGIETAYTFISVDFCSTIGSSIISGITPSENTGLGTYLSCPSKDTMRTISTSIYQYIVNFDNLYDQIRYNISNNTYFSVLNLGTDKRDNEYFRELKEKVELVNYTSGNPLEEKRCKELKEDITASLDIFVYVNYILAGLLSMTSCLTAKNSINLIEQDYCYENHDYMFNNIVFSVLTGLGFIITSAGINKLIIVMRNRYARALRGKKEFNTDIITEDDDD